MDDADASETYQYWLDAHQTKLGGYRDAGPLHPELAVGVWLATGFAGIAPASLVGARAGVVLCALGLGGSQPRPLASTSFFHRWSSVRDR